MQTFEAIVENGSIRPLEPVPLRDGDHLVVSIIADDDPRFLLDKLVAEQGVQEPTNIDSAARVAGLIDDEFLRILRDHGSSQSATR